MTPRPYGSLFLICAAVCLFLPAVSAQKQGQDCRNLVANHTYAISFEGYLNVGLFFDPTNLPDWGDEPNAGLGRLTFYPDGTVKNTQTILVGLLGVTLDEPLTGTYSLHWDSSRGPKVCTGTMTEADGFYNFQIIVSQNGQRLEMIHTDVGLGVNPAGFLMEVSGCSNKSIGGTYTYNTKGWGMLPVAVPTDQTFGGYVPGGMSGAIRFYPGVPASGTYANTPPAGAASVKAWDTVSSNGQIIQRTMTGWYKVNRDCSVRLVLNDSKFPEYIIEAYVGQNGDKVAMLNINSIDIPDYGPVPAFLMPIPLERAVLDDQR